MRISRFLVIVRIGIVLVIALSLGIVLGAHLEPHVAQASGVGKVVSFESAINGKLEVIPPVPQVSVNLIATEDGADFMATQIRGVVKRHRHDHSAEFFYVVSGSGTVTIGNTKSKITPGDMIAIPKAVPHSIASMGAPLHLVEIDAPSIAENDLHWMP